MLQQNICGNAIGYLGAGPDFGNGVLPRFLREAASARKRGVNTALLLLRSAESSVGSDRGGKPRHDGGSDFVEPLKDIAGDAEVVDTAHRALPLRAFRQAVERLTGFDPVAEEPDRSDFPFFLLGCDTEKRILAIATFLRSILRYVTFQLAEVAVSRDLFRKILSLIDDLRRRPAPA